MTVDLLNVRCGRNRVSQSDEILPVAKALVFCSRRMETSSILVTVVARQQLLSDRLC